ncbi:hypothetical protein, partial [Pseudobutyrivibrio sp.]
GGGENLMKKTVLSVAMLVYLIFALFFIFVLGGSMWALVFGLALGELSTVKDRVRCNTRALNTLRLVSFLLLAITSVGLFGQPSEAIFFVELVGYLIILSISFYNAYDEKGAKKL